MKKALLLLTLTFAFTSTLLAQTNPIITEWLQNNTITGSYYEEGNATPIAMTDLANIQSVDYSDNYVYITATGIPSYITGPFLDGNPFIAENQNSIFQFPLIPTQNTGTTTATRGGYIGVFINGVAIFDWRDGVSWDDSTGALCGGPGNPTCPGGGGGGTGDWNRDAVPAEMDGFDCNKGHPGMGVFHHHQNPSAFDLDLVVVSEICDTYPADGLYVINSMEHSPLIGFAYDGFPVYGAYAYTNTDGTGAITRMKSSYSVQSGVTTRTDGPDIDEVVNGETFFNGYFKEDYVYTENTDPDYLDEHNGRFCITPEYPTGTYCYFATVDTNHNSAYPYTVGLTYYGNVAAGTVTTIDEPTTTYDPTLSTTDFDTNRLNLTVYPNPAQDFIAIQSNLQNTTLKVELLNELGQIVQTSQILQGSTLSIIETHTLYNGLYFLKVSENDNSKTYKVVIKK